MCLASNSASNVEPIDVYGFASNEIIERTISKRLGRPRKDEHKTVPVAALVEQAQHLTPKAKTLVERVEAKNMAPSAPIVPVLSVWDNRHFSYLKRQHVRVGNLRPIRKFQNHAAKVRIYRFGSIYRIIILYADKGIQRLHAKFVELDKCVRFANKLIYDALVHRVLARYADDGAPREYKIRETDGRHSPPKFLDTFIDWKALAIQKRAFTGGDEEGSVYWFKRGAGRALAETRHSVPSWAR